MKKVLFFLFIGFLIQHVNAQEVNVLQDKKTNNKIVKNVSAEIFYEMVKKDKTPQIIDIRTPNEYNSGHLKNAVLINFYNHNFIKNLDNKNLDKNKPVYIYCRSGHRSGNSIKFFQKSGFKTIINLKYGINDWHMNKFPLEQ